MKERRRLGVRTKSTPEARKAVRNRAEAESRSLSFGFCSDCQRGHCFWCGRAFLPGMPPTRDHWRPFQNEARQTVAACLSCNSTRGNDDTWQPWHKSLGNVLLPESQLAYEMKKGWEE